MLPSIFVSHGSPMLSIQNNRTTKFLEELPSMFDKPKYILVISAHWTSDKLEILSNPEPSIIHDFYGFPKELYEQEYKAFSDIHKINEIENLLKQNNIEVSRNNRRIGFDHGVWSPLSIMYPDANIPIIQLSLPMSFKPKELVVLGKVLSVLRNDTLILSSGAMTHNLKDAKFSKEDDIADSYAKEFHDWVIKKVEQKEDDALINFIEKAPFVYKNHPSLEHFLPFFVTLGSSSSKKGESLHDFYMYGNQSMDTILFKE